MLRPLALAVCGLLVATLRATPAQATPAQAMPASAAAPISRVTLADATEDVWLIGPGEDTWHFFGARPAVDVTRAAGEYRPHAVTVTLHFVNLRRVRPQDFVVRVRSSSGFRRAIISTGPGDWAGTGRLLNRAEQQVGCPQLGHRVDYGRDRVRVRIPRHCLGEPDWVRLAISAFLFRPMSALSDNPHNTGPEPTYTRRLRRAVP